VSCAELLAVIDAVVDADATATLRPLMRSTSS
jgi:hypothetical protein